MKNQVENKGRAKAIRNLIVKNVSQAVALKRVAARFDISPSLFSRIWDRNAKRVAATN
jgi:AraC-like DNA-binding protein